MGVGGEKKRLDDQGRDFHREVFLTPRAGTIYHFVISLKNLKFRDFFYLFLFKFNNRLIRTLDILLSKVCGRSLQLLNASF